MPDSASSARLNKANGIVSHIKNSDDAKPVSANSESPEVRPTMNIQTATALGLEKKQHNPKSIYIYRDNKVSLPMQRGQFTRWYLKSRHRNENQGTAFWGRLIMTEVYTNKGVAC